MSNRYGTHPEVTPFERLQDASLSEHGFKYALQRLDPAGYNGPACGIPDRVSAPSTLVPSVCTGTVSCDMTLPAQSATWDLAIVCSPMLSTGAILLRKASTVPWPDNFPVKNASKGVDPSGWNHVDPAECEAYIWSFSETNGNEEPIVHALGVRLACRSVTSESIGPQLYRSGTVTSGQFLTECGSIPTAMTLDGDGGVAGRTQSANYIRFPPLDPNAIVMYDKLSGQRPASDGDYSVTRFSSSTGVPDVHPAWLGQCYFYGSDIAMSDYVPSYDGWTAWKDTLTLHGNTTVTVYSGLSIQDVIRVKVLSSVEVYPLPHSSLARLAQPSPSLDQGAIDLISEIESQLPHSYPASYNDLGGLLGVIGTFLKERGIPLSRTIGGLGIPGVSPIAAAIGHVGSIFGW